MSEIYSTMKINQTPSEDEESRENGRFRSSAFPSNEIIEELKSHDIEFQTFELITYEKDNQNDFKDDASKNQKPNIKTLNFNSESIPELDMISRNEIIPKNKIINIKLDNVINF